MRKFILIVLAGAAMMLAAPQFASAAPAALGTNIAAAADQVSTVDVVRHRRWHRRHWRCHCHHRHWRHHHRWHHRHHHHRHHHRHHHKS